MSVAEQFEAGRAEALPDGIGSARAKLVFLYLRVCEGGTPGELRATLDVPKVTLLPVLESLRERGFVERRGDVYVPAA